jgi:hypothetical protein
MRLVWISFTLAVLIHGNAFAEADLGSVCVAPMMWEPQTGDRPRLSAPGLYCDPTEISLKIDEHVIPSPVKESVKIAELDLTSRHRVTVFCDHKPQQSFVFRFSDFKSKQLCLFLNSLYMTTQLWEAKRAPWCKCK